MNRGYIPNPCNVQVVKKCQGVRHQLGNSPQVKFKSPIKLKGVTRMPITEVTLMRICGSCNQVIETFTVKKDNLQMFSDSTVWCDNCQSEQPEHLDIAGRNDAIKTEQDSYPANLPIIIAP